MWAIFKTIEIQDQLMVFQEFFKVHEIMDELADKASKAKCMESLEASGAGAFFRT